MEFDKDKNETEAYVQRADKLENMYFTPGYIFLAS